MVDLLMVGSLMGERSMVEALMMEPLVGEPLMVEPLYGGASCGWSFLQKSEVRGIEKAL